MKTRYIVIMILAMSISFTACDEDENLPDFLNGTEFGILLNVDVTAGETIAIGDISTSSVNFAVTYDDDERPVQTIAVMKTFVAADGTTSDTIEQTSVTSSPATVNLSVDDLVSGITGLSTGDIVSGDIFSIEFIITYVDGFVVDRYGTGVNPNFNVSFVD